MTQDLTEDELEVAEASITFALQNCPVEGILSTEDGSPITLDMLQDLLDALKGAEMEPGNATSFNREELLRLEGVMSYTYENCPVEGATTFHDGRLISGRESAALVAKIRGLLEAFPPVSELTPLAR